MKLKQVNPKNENKKINQHTVNLGIRRIAMALLVLVALIPLALMGCPNGGNNQIGTIEAKFIVSSQHLNGQQVTIVFPANLSKIRRDAIQAKFVDAMGWLNTEAGIDGTFKIKINAILDRGLKIIIEETKVLSYYVKVVNKQLVVETTWVEDLLVDGGGVAGEILYQINNNHLVAQVNRLDTALITEAHIMRIGV